MNDAETILAAMIVTNQLLIPVKVVCRGASCLVALKTEALVALSFPDFSIRLKPVLSDDVLPEGWTVVHGQYGSSYYCPEHRQS